jgi:hypothetical protein
MKKLAVGILAALSFASANAATWWVDGVLYGNICRSGIYYTVYPLRMGQPVGTVCPIRDYNGYIIGWGTVSNE